MSLIVMRGFSLGLEACSGWNGAKQRKAVVRLE